MKPDNHRLDHRLGGGEVAVDTAKKGIVCHWVGISEIIS